MKNTLIFYREWWEVIRDYPEEERLALYEAVMEYAFDGVMPEDKFIKAVTALMRSSIDRNTGKYEDVSRKRREAAEKRWRMQMHTTNASDASDTTDANNADNESDNVNYNESDKESDKDKEKTSKEVQKKDSVRRFVKPTIDEVDAYCRQRGNNIDAEAFWSFYESKGWVVGKSPMKDWKRAVITWEKKDGYSVRQTPKGVNLGVGEWIDERGERRYGTGMHTVPMSAPPRPGEGCYWSGESQNWVSGV